MIFFSFYKHQLLIYRRIEYNKKPGKPSVVKVVKDNTVPRDDIYKSGTIHTGQGEPPNSRSKPTPRPKQVASKPITNGKLLRPGGPKGGPSKLASRPAATRPVPQPTPQTPPRSQPVASQSRPIPQPVPVQTRLVPQPQAPVNGISHERNGSSSSMNRTNPPPPPPPPPAQAPVANKKIYRVLYDFQGQTQSEMSFLHKDELLEIIKQEGNGILSPSIIRCFRERF